jgi:hypothetical protein
MLEPSRTIREETNLMSDNVTLVFHGFLNLTNLEKLAMVKEINNYFDSMSREPIRAENEAKFQQLDKEKSCKCCGK